MVNPKMKLKLTALPILLNFAGVAGATCVAAACYGFVYAPMTQENIKLRQREEMLKRLEGSRERVRSRNRAIQKSIDALKPGDRELAARLPAAPRDDELLKQLSRLAKQSEVHLQDFQPGGRATFGDLNSTIVKLHLRCDYEKLCRFIAAVEKMKRLTRLADVKVHVADQSKGLLDIHIRLLAFFQPAGLSPEK